MRTVKDSPDKSELKRQPEEKLKEITSGSEDLSEMSPKGSRFYFTLPVKAGVGDQVSGIGDQGSGIGDRGSGVRRGIVNSDGERQEVIKQ